MTSLTVHQTEAALGARGQVPSVLTLDLRGAALHAVTVAQVLSAGEVKQVLGRFVVFCLNPVDLLVAKVLCPQTPAEVRHEQPEAVLLILQQRMELLTISAVNLCNQLIYKVIMRCKPISCFC